MKVLWRYILLAVFGGIIVFRLLSLSWEQFVSLDVTQGLFGEETENTTDAVRDSLLIRQSQMVYFTAEETPSGPTLFDSLADHPSISSTSRDTSAIGKVLFENRFVLFFPTWLERHLSGQPPEAPGVLSKIAESAADELMAFLQSPDSLGMEDYIAKDPLLLLPTALEELSQESTLASLRWAEIDGSAFDPSTQSSLVPVFEKIAGGEAWTGAIRFAETSRREIQAEVKTVNVISALAVVAVVVLLLRRPASLFHVAVPVLFAAAGGLFFFSLTDREIHIISLILGSVLTGISVDYGIHVLLHPKSQNRSDLIRSLLIAGISSIAGFTIIAFTANPVIRDAGLLVAFGLLSGLFTALLYPPLNQNRPEVRFGKFLSRPAPIPKVVLGIAFVGLAFCSVVGLIRITWNDDMRVMDISNPKLNADAENLLGQSGSAPQTVVAVGDSYIEAIDRINQVAPGGLIDSFPTAKRINANEAFAKVSSGFVPALETAFQARDLETAAFDSFFEDLDTYLNDVKDGSSTASIEAALSAVAEVIPAPLQFMLGREDADYWAGSIKEQRENDPLVFSLSGDRNLTQKMAEFRKEFMIALLTGAIAVAAGLLIFVRSGDRLAVLVPLFLSSAITLGLIALFQPLNLFHLAGMLLGLCIGLDYLIFYRTFRRQGGHFPQSIRFSWFTTSAAFAALLFCRIEAVFSLGFTVLILMIVVHLWIEIDRKPSKRILISTRL